MSSFREQLWRKIQNYRLDETNDYWKNILCLLEQGILTESDCPMLLFQIEGDIERCKDFPEFLHRSPTNEQLHGHHPPDLILGHLPNSNIAVGICIHGPVFVLLSGLVGFGKTTAIRILLQAIHNMQQSGHPIIVVVFDRKGGDYADLATLFGWRHYRVYQSLYLSLENPLGVPADIWINIVASLFCARAGLKAASVTLVNALRWLLAVMNPQPAQRLLWPDLCLLLQVLKVLPPTVFSSKPEYTASLIMALEGITQTTGTTFRAFQGFQVSDLIEAKTSAIIAMPNVEPAWARQFLVDLIISQVLRQRLETSHRVDQLEVLFVVDEADADVGEEAEKNFGDVLFPLAQVFKQGRELGLGSVVTVSSLYRTARLIRENATYHLAFRPNDADSVVSAARTLMLPPNGEQTLMCLQPGEVIIRQIGLWPHAMKVKIQYLPPARVQVTEYDTHPMIPAKNLEELPDLIRAVEQLRRQYQEGQERIKSISQPPIAELGMKFLRLAVDHPYMPFACLVKQLGKLRFPIQVELRQWLQNQGWACFEEVRIGSANYLLLEVTSKGYQELHINPPQENQGRGGIIHRHFCHWIKKTLEKKGACALLELLLPGTSHPVDVAAPSANHWTIYEVSVTAVANLVSHIQMCFEQTHVTVDQLIIVAAQKALCKKLQQTLEQKKDISQYLDRVKFEEIGNYLKEAFTS